MIYVPNKSYPCYVIIDANTIRAYHSYPYSNSNINYTDYYINSHYLEKVGQQSFGSYYTSPACLSSSLITNEVYYRNDFADILIIFLIMCIFCFLIPIKIFIRLFRRFQ